MDEKNSELWQAAVEAHLDMPLPVATNVLWMFVFAIGVTLLIMLFVAAPRLRGKSRRYVWPTTGLLASALVLFIPGALMASMQTMMLGFDPQQTAPWQISTTTFEAVAREINQAMMFGVLGIFLLLGGVALLWVSLSTCQHASQPGQAARHAAPRNSAPDKPGTAQPIAPTVRLPPLQAPPQATARIRVVRPARGSTRLSTIETEIHIGRDPDQCTLVIDDPFVLAYHARIFQQNGEFFLEDKSSTGICVDGEKIPVGFPFKLQNEMRIGLGCALLHFSMVNDEQTDYLVMWQTQHAMLIYLDENKQEHPFVVPLTEPVARLGRHQKIQFTSQRVSRYHADIHDHNGSYYLVNKSEGGQTFVDDEHATEETLLRHGQIITLGDQYVRFELENEDNDATDYSPRV